MKLVKKNKWTRRCRRCDKIYISFSKGSKFCDDCKIPPYYTRLHNGDNVNKNKQK